MEDFFDTEEEEWDVDEQELVARYENTLKNRKSDFFSVDDYEELYFHYINFYADVFYMQGEQVAKGEAVLKAAIAQYPDAEILHLLQIYHAFKVTRLSKKMLVNQLENIRFPVYEQEHFTHILAHIYRQVGERKKARSLFASLLENADDAEDKTVLLYEIMFLYETAKDAPQVVECCNKILQIGEENRENLFWEMYEYFFLKPVAIPVFELLTQQDAFSMEAWMYLGKSYADVLMYDEATQALNYAVSLSDNHPAPLVALGRVYMELAKVSEAFECFQEAIALEPSLTVLYVEMGELLYMAEDAERSMYFFSLALDANQNNISALLGMALALSALERYDDSIAYIMRVKKIEELPIAAWLLLADDYIELDRDEEAVEIFQRLVKEHPKDVDVWLSYSNYYAVIEDFQQACEVAKQGLAILNNDPFLLYRIANYCVLGKDIPQGITYLRLAYYTNADYLPVFTEYDEEVMKIAEVAEVVDLLKGKNEEN
jgi:tetratricopeptide (TPR) repeat protein